MRQAIRNSKRAKWLAIAILNWVHQTIGASPLNWPKLPQELVWFFRSRACYMQQANLQQEKIWTYPILFQRNEMGYDAHYTYQAAWAARRIMTLGIQQHIDVSSDLRFVTLLSAFVPVLYIEYRPVTIRLEGLQTQQGNALALPFADQSVSSISCLHVIEHIGLGRYGDPLDVNGSRNALAELERVVVPGGTLLLSVPIGRPRTVFNAHRIFDPNVVQTFVPKMKLVEFSVVTTQGKLIERTSPMQFFNEEYACGLYWFKCER